MVKSKKTVVIVFVDESGKTVVNYSYDSWGRILDITGELKDTIGIQNPFRYRGYYYDNETGFYYVSSRYYDPEVGRTNNPIRRQREHDRDSNKAHLDPLEVKFTGLTRIEARVMEQVVISAYTLQNLDNARREIAVGNVNGFEGKMNNIINIFGGAIESELLSLMGR